MVALCGTHLILPAAVIHYSWPLIFVCLYTLDGVNNRHNNTDGVISYTEMFYLKGYLWFSTLWLHL